MLIVLEIVNILLVCFLVYRSFPIQRNIEAETYIEEPGNEALQRIAAFRERMVGVTKDRDGLYEVSPPITNTEFTGTEVITPSMEVQSDRRF